jgi:hypothetical protein
MSGSWLSSVLNATRNFLVGLPCASIERVHVEQAKVLRPVDDALGLVRAEGGGVVDQGAGDGGKGEAVDGGEVVGCQCAAMDNGSSPSHGRRRVLRRRTSLVKEAGPRPRRRSCG